MKTILEFNGDEVQEIYDAQNGLTYKNIINKIIEHIRYETKHNDDLYDLDGGEAFEKLLDFIDEEIKESEVYL